MTRMLRGSVVLGCTLLALALFAVPASAAKPPNSCRVLKRRKIAKVFGGAHVGKGKQSRTPATSDCDYKVSAVGDRPAGTVTVHLMTRGAKAAFHGIQDQTAGFAPITGLGKGKAIYSQKLGGVDVLQGKTLIGVQGVFDTIDSNGVMRQYDPRAEVVKLVKIARRRV